MPSPDIVPPEPGVAERSPPRGARKHVTVVSAGSILGRSEATEECEPMSIFGFTTTTGQLDWQQIAPRISAMKVTNADFLRATFASSILQCFGRSLFLRDAYKYSFKTLSIDQYWSHSWADKSWKKILVLLWLNNGLLALISGTLAAAAMMPLFSLGFLPAIPGNLWKDEAEAETVVSLWCLVAGLVVFLLVLLLARPRKMVFVDKVCLNEGDGQMKQEGMLNMGACLKHSKSLLVLWEKSYAQQLISIFELATFLKCHEGEKTHLDIRPTMLAPFFLVNFFGSAFIALAQIFVPFDHDWTIFVVAACFTPYFMACGWLLLRYFASVQGLKDQLNHFGVDDAVCPCCLCGHRVPGTVAGAENSTCQCDRKIILECINVWFGSIEEFERFVSSKVARAFSQRLGNFLCQYWMVVVLSAPIFWAHLDLIAVSLARTDYLAASSLAVTAFTWWLGILPAAYVLFIALVAKSQRRQMRRTGIAQKLCWRIVPPSALLLLLLVAGMYQTFCIRYITNAVLGIGIFGGTLIIPCYLIWRASTKNTAMFNPRSVAEEASRVRAMRGF